MDNVQSLFVGWKINFPHIKSILKRMFEFFTIRNLCLNLTNESRSREILKLREKHNSNFAGISALLSPSTLLELQELRTVFEISRNSVDKSSDYLTRYNKCQNCIIFVWLISVSVRIISVFVRIWTGLGQFVDGSQNFLISH